MKPDDAMPFFGTAFFQAVRGYSDAVALGYLRALWQYYNHTHCEGLPDDDEYLRRLCECPMQEWSRTKPIIFDNKYFFCMNGTHWHQKNAKEIHAKERELYQRRVAWAQNARDQKALANTSPAIKAKVSVADRISMERELDRVIERLKQLRKAGTEVAGGAVRYTDKQQDEMKALRDRGAELRKALGVVA